MGQLILKSTFAQEVTLDLAPMVVHETRWIGSRCGPFQPALELLSTGQIQTLPLIQATYSLTQWREAFDQASQPGALKMLFTP